MSIKNKSMIDTFEHLENLRWRIKNLEKIKENKNELIQPPKEETVQNGIEILGYLPPRILHMISEKDIFVASHKKIIIRIKGRAYNLIMELISTGIRYSFENNPPFIIDKNAFGDIKKTSEKVDGAIFEFEQKDKNQI